MRQSEADAIVADEGRHPPDGVMKSVRPAMQMMWPVVRRQLIRRVVERKAPACDAVRVAPDDRAEVRRSIDVGRELVEAKDDIGKLTRTIRHAQPLHDSAVREN